MTIYESKAVSCFGFPIDPNKPMLRSQVTVCAQWDETGRFRLVQATKPLKESETSWFGRVFYLPTDDAGEAEYFCSVFNLLAHSPHGSWGKQRTF